MKTLCALRDIYRSIRDMEDQFQHKHDLCLNEGMMLCSLKNGSLTSTELADVLGLTTSNTSKVIKAVENKGFVERALGKDDKRQMYFTLTTDGVKKLSVIKQEESAILGLLANIKGLAELSNKE